ncbi:MAG: Stp1/IreP family PP2C-type Ser/Thr phosphatase [Chloroflexota bacterium]
MNHADPGIHCPTCQTLNRRAAKVCKQCGTRLPEPTARLAPPAPPQKDATRHLPATGFSELPRGAIVHKRFEVIRVLEAQPHANSYLVADGHSARQCMLLESSDLQHYQREQRFLEYGVHHAALVELYETFQVSYGDETRAYLAQEFPLSQIAPNDHREIAVLQWGAQLASALAHLHAKQIAHGDIQPANLYLAENQIKLGGYSAITELKAETATQDIYQLAYTLSQLAIPRGKNASALSPGALKIVQGALEQRYRDARAFQADLQQAVDALRHPARITTLVGRLSDVGRKRDLDEDSLLTTEIVQYSQTDSQVIGLYAVADGMGGASAGEIASKMVTETLAREVTQKILAPRFTMPDVALDYAEILQIAIEQANAHVLAARTQAHTDMGSTVVAALLVGSHAYIANVGDSRAYLIARDQIAKLTKDHSLVQALADRGTIAEADIRTHPQRNIILRNVGDKPQLQVDLFEATLEPGQSLLLCCDGLWEMVLDNQIRDIVTQHANPQDACRELIRIANENGGDDNITCVIVRVEAA